MNKANIKANPGNCCCFSCRHFIPDDGQKGSIGRCRFIELVWVQTRYIGDLRDKCKNYHPSPNVTNEGG